MNSISKKHIPTVYGIYIEGNLSDSRNRCNVYYGSGYVMLYFKKNIGDTSIPRETRRVHILKHAICLLNNVSHSKKRSPGPLANYTYTILISTQIA